MDIEAIRKFCEFLGLQDIREDKERGWVNASCPFAPFKHRNGLDTNPSFGISISKDDQRPHYKCFSCDSTGDLRDLLHNLMWLYGKPFGEAQTFLQQEHPEIFKFEDVDHSNKKKRIRYDKLLSAWEKERHINATVPNHILEKYPLLYGNTDWDKLGISQIDVAEIKHYLETKRKISPKVSEMFQLRFYKADYGALGVVFPILTRDKTPETIDLWVRLIDSKKNFRLSANLTGSPVDYHAPASWFGEHLFDTGQATFLVEGAFDAMRLKSLGVGANVVACMGNPSKEQLMNPNILTRVVLLGFDSDEAGVKFAKNALAFVSAPRIYLLDWAKVGKKDAGDLESQEQFLKVYEGRLMVSRPSQGVDVLR